MTTTPTPRPHQIAALTDLTAALAVHDRTQLVMACGTGKTLVGRWHAQASDARQVLVLLPSLALVAQTLREWRRATGQISSGWRFEALVVCSDPTTAAGVAERTVDDQVDVDVTTWSDVGAEVTTDPRRAARFLRNHDPARPQVVFSTYHSSAVIADAQAATDARFDLVICDEAHRLAGNPSTSFATVLDPRRIVARKRLFMTATPKDGGDSSMDAPRTFGPVAHTVSFGDAIAAGLLTDYQVLVVAGHGSDATNPDTTVPAALTTAIDNHGLTRVLSFHGRVAKAAAFAEAMDMRSTAGGHRIRAKHVAGTMRTSDRIATLEWLGGRGTDVRMVSNARCLSEGVDVPAIDGIMFADKRTSIVDIIQAIGRVLRPAPGKRIGTIILPVELDETGDDDTALSLSSYAAVWTVLRGLRAHDQRFADEVDHAIREHARTGHRGGFRLPRISFVFPDGFDQTALQLRVVQEVGSMWERNYGLLQAWAAANNGKLLPRGAKSLDSTISLGEWAEQQRIARRRGVLDATRSARLEEIPGWSWDKSETRWMNTLALLRSYAAEHGTIAEHPAGESRFAGMYDADSPRRHLGIWMATQRQAYRLGTLPADKIAHLEALPGWAWDADLPAGDVDMVEALRQFVEFEKHASVPDDHLEDGLRLGAWCWAVRRRWLTIHLAPALQDEILAATPSRDRPAVRWQWEKIETQWRIGYFALKQYTDREGTATPPGTHREQLPDTLHGLGQWGALQRLKHRRGELDQTKVELLEALPGWVWEVDLQRVEAQEPITLRPGSEHGTAGSYSNYGCRCEPCLEWRRSADRARLAKRRELKDPVPALRARRHLERIEQAVLASQVDAGSRNGRSIVAAVSGVSLGAIRNVLNGATHLEREHETRLLAVTLAMVDAARSQTGSRGRATSQLTTRIDSGPSFELLDDLSARGFGPSWVGRELGYTSAPQLRRGRSISGYIAQAIADLHRRVGDLVMPDLPKNAPRPTLAQLRASTAEREAS